MKSTGIVRCIDDLGRIVIPKEIRRTMRIYEGSPLEIYTDRSGNIILKKHSIIEEISSFAHTYADILAQSINMPVLISDFDNIIAVAGISKKEFLKKKITKSFGESIKCKNIFSLYNNPNEKFIPIEGLQNQAAFIYPIISSGNVIGGICVLKNKDSEQNLNENEYKIRFKLVEITSQFLGKHFDI